MVISPDKTQPYLPLDYEPELADIYRTQKSGVIGVVVQKVRNRTGSVRLLLITPDLETRWTTWKRGE